MVGIQLPRQVSGCVRAETRPATRPTKFEERPATGSVC